MKKTVFFGILAVLLSVSMIQKGRSMGLFDRLFGKTKAVTGRNLSEHMPLLDSLRIPAVRMEKSKTSGLSKIGGLPMAHESLKWPEWNNKPLAFLCQIDCGDIPKTESTALLPGDGILYFFYDQKQGTWGFDPKDRGSWKIVYMKEKGDLKPVPAPSGLAEEFIYREKYVTFSHMLMYPDWQDERIQSEDWDDDQFDEYFDMRSSLFNNQPSHQLLGYPSPVQGNDMDLECQLASNGLYCGNASGYNDPKAQTLKTGRSQWVLLLQLDTDDETGMMWGDSGMLYFWIKKEDLEKQDFSNAWMILQCY